MSSKKTGELKWLIIGGTADARQLCEQMQEQGMILQICVAEQNGAEALSHLPADTLIHIGRKNHLAFEKLILEQQINRVIDCSHPYAYEVSKEITIACNNLNIKCWRLNRAEAISETDYKINLELDSIVRAADIEQAISLANQISGNILLTTGVNHLEKYAVGIENSKNRLYVRVLPVIPSLKICLKNEIKTDHIIAQQGPFSVEMNRALIRQYDIKLVISKEGGELSGIKEKIKAVQQEKVKLALIRRPEKAFDYEFVFDNVEQLLASCIQIFKAEEDSNEIKEEVNEKVIDRIKEQNTKQKAVTAQKALMLAGTGSGCGKTTITAALLAAFAQKGKEIQPFKTGPDYIDPMFHQAACGITGINLDSWLLDAKTINSLFAERMTKNDRSMALIEGVMGLYDGLSDTMEGSTATLANILDVPIILLIDGSGLALSICAIINGYINFHEETGKRIVGVILNKVSAGGYSYLKPLIEKHCNITVVGFLPKVNDCELGSRHLGLIPPHEDQNLKMKIEKLARIVQETIDIEKLEKLAEMNSFDLSEKISFVEIEKFKHKFNCRIAIAKDKAFNFYYEDNLDLLRKMGVELIFFSPLEDNNLPDNIDGLYLGGGYPEVFAAQLSVQTELRCQIRKKILSGLPTVAECGGLYYLSQTAEDMKGKIFEMSGVLPIDIRMTDRLQNFGYQTLTLQHDGLLGKKGDIVRAHEFHYSASSNYGDSCVVNKSSGRSWQSIFHSNSYWIGYSHLHFYSQPSMAISWLKKCLEYQNSLKEGNYEKYE